MLEIILLFFLCKKMGDMMRLKDRNPIGLQILTVLSWFGGEVFGAIAGVIILMIAQGEKAMANGPSLLLYVFALVGAAISVTIVFIIAKLIPARAVEVAPVYDLSENQ